jgi:hypothetical protein
VRRWGGLALLGALGLGLRLWIVLRSYGSNDLVYWEQFGETIRDLGLLECYRTIKYFNHPPLMGIWAMVVYDASRTYHLAFAPLFKILPLAADIGTAVLLARHWQARGRATLAVAIFALSPTAILLSAYHGNTDSLAACLCLWAGLLFDRGALFRSGLALGAAINVKLIPVLLIAVFACQARTWRDLRRFAGGLALAALPFVPLLLILRGRFVANVVAYKSIPNHWGLIALLEAGRVTPHLQRASGWLFELLRAQGRLLVLAVPLALGIWGRRRHESSTALAAATLLLFLAVTPGFGVQYSVYALPLLLGADLALGAVYSLVMGAFLFVSYLEMWTGTSPWFSDFSQRQPVLATLLGLVAWTALFPLAYALLRRKTIQHPPLTA